MEMRHIVRCAVRNFRVGTTGESPFVVFQLDVSATYALISTLIAYNMFVFFSCPLRERQAPSIYMLLAQTEHG
jgi:hypothetical protein